MSDHFRWFIIIITIAFFSRLASRFVEAKVENDASIAADTRRIAVALEIIAKERP